jgi:hypothetical protein
MELELATIEGIIEELQKRQLRFVFIGVEDTNSRRDDMVFVAGKGFGPDDISRLIHLGQAAFDGLNDEADGPDEDA